MKQHLTTKQLNELTQEGVIKLGEWSHAKYANDNKNHPNWNNFDKKNKFGLLPLLNIGQMLEFLGDNDVKVIFAFNPDLGWQNHGRRCSSITLAKHGKEKLCDVLWEAVKEVLNEN